MAKALDAAIARDARIINMSLGAAFEHQARDTLGKVIRDSTGKAIHTARGSAQLQRLIGKATTYAYQRGVTVIAALGNDAINLDKTNDLIFLPAMAPHVIGRGVFNIRHTGQVMFEDFAILLRQVVNHFKDLITVA